MHGIGDILGGKPPSSEGGDHEEGEQYASELEDLREAGLKIEDEELFLAALGRLVRGLSKGPAVKVEVC